MEMEILNRLIPYQKNAPEQDSDNERTISENIVEIVFKTFKKLMKNIIKKAHICVAIRCYYYMADIIF